MTRSLPGFAPSIALLACVLILTACGKNDSDAGTPNPTTRPAIATSAPAITSPADPTKASFHGMTAPVPEGWTWSAPKHNLRAANYTVPAAPGSDTAEMIVFDRSIGGSLEQNIDRWVKQFRASEGETVRPGVEEFDVEGMAVTTVEISGAYGGMSGNYVDGRTMIQAVIEAPDGKIFIRLLGPSDTIDANREAFMTMIRGIRP